MHELIASYVKNCGIAEVLNPALLSGVRKTALPWTDVPGAVALAMNLVYLRMALENKNVAAVIIPPALFPLPNELSCTGKTLIVAERAEELFYLLHLDKPFARYGLPDLFVATHVAQSAEIHSTAIVEDGVYIGENAVIGAYTVVHGNSYIGDGCWVGSHCSIGTGSFFPRSIMGRKMHIPHQGGVRLGKGCRLYGHNIVAASSYYLEFTELGDEVYLGFQTTVGHDAKIGNKVDMSAKALVAGRVSMGDETWVGPGACISNSLEIGRKAEVKIGAVVVENVSDGCSVSGNFAINHQKNILRMLKGEK